MTTPGKWSIFHDGYDVMLKNSEDPLGVFIDGEPAIAAKLNEMEAELAALREQVRRYDEATQCLRDKPASIIGGTNEMDILGGAVVHKTPPGGTP